MEITAERAFNRGGGWLFEDTLKEGHREEPHGQKPRRKRSVAFGITWATGYAFTPLPGDPSHKEAECGKNRAVHLPTV